MAELSRGTTSNRILARLSRANFALLQPHLDPVDLPVRKRLEIRNKRIEQVYFIEHGFASVVANGEGDRSIEVGLIGREGMTGLAVVFGKDRSRHETFVQAAGGAQRISATNLRRALEQSPDLLPSLLSYAHAFLMQTTETALSNGADRVAVGAASDASS